MNQVSMMAEKSSKPQCAGETVCCVFRGRLSVYHAHPQGWTSSELKEFFAERIILGPGMCVCRACDSDIKKGFRLAKLGKPYTPRWQKHSRVVCWVPNCTEQSRPVIRNHPFARETICPCVSTLQYHSGTSELPLCALHYQLV